MNRIQNIVMLILTHDTKNDTSPALTCGTNTGMWHDKILPWGKTNLKEKQKKLKITQTNT